MARLVVTPCASCGAPLEQDLELARETTCPFCGAVTPVAPQEPPPKASGLGVGVVLGALFGAIVLLVGGGLAIEELANRSNADRVTDLRELGDLIVPTRAAALADGGVWVACRHDRLCVLDRGGNSQGSAPLPLAPMDAPRSARGDATHSMAADRAGRVYVSHGGALIEFAASALAERRRLSALPEGEYARCLAVAPDESLWSMTSKDDIVKLDSERVVRARWTQPVLKHDARHHGCSSLVVDASGRVWVTPEGAPALYVLSPAGELLRRHAPGGPGHYSGIAVLPRDRVVLGYSSWLVLLDAEFRELDGPKARRDSSAQIGEVLHTPDDALVVVTTTGHVMRWERVSERW